MKHRIEKAAVLGAGTMGSRIAAHLANAGVPCILLDIVPPDLKPGASAADRNKIVRAGLEAAKKSKPAAFFTPALAEKVSIGNFEDDLARCAEADWIIEVVAENLEIKRNLLSRVAQFRKPGAIVTTNTSGLPVHLIAQAMSDEFQQHWAGTHFFNPPRYMKLVEVIPGPKTSSEVIETLSEFCDRRLGKGVVVAKDTPNFIANRIGTYSMLNALRLMTSLGMTVEEVDACTGPAVGWPKSATFRTADLVGLDVLVHVIKNIYETAPNDESHEMYKVPALIEEMVKRKWLGDKTGQGFYKKVRGEGEKEILTLDTNTMEYRPRQKPKFASIEMGKAIEDTRERLRALTAALVVVAVTTASYRIGSFASGLLALFPIVICCSIVILHPRVGGKASASVLAHAQVAFLGLAFGFLAVHFLAEPLGAWWALLIGLAVSAAWSGLLWLLRTRAISSSPAVP